MILPQVLQPAPGTAADGCSLFRRDRVLPGPRIRPKAAQGAAHLNVPPSPLSTHFPALIPARLCFPPISPAHLCSTSTAFSLWTMLYQSESRVFLSHPRPPLTTHHHNLSSSACFRQGAMRAPGHGCHAGVICAHITRYPHALWPLRMGPKPSHGTMWPRTLPAGHTPLASLLRRLCASQRPRRRPPSRRRSLSPASRSREDVACCSNRRLSKCADGEQTARILDASTMFARSQRASVRVYITPHCSFPAAGRERFAS